MDKTWEIIKEVLTYPLIKMGAGSITLQSLLILCVLFVLVLLLEKIVRERVIMRIFEKTDLPESLEYGLARIMGYVFIVIGWYMSLQFVGVDLSSLALIAGGISVGVGFGLQNIINNFVSGIIIFAERPIAIGDRVEVSGVAGRVVKISLRSTTVITNDNITMIVPNADFISQTVTNWSHGDPKVRIRVPVGVAYGSDIELLEKLLLEIADENPKSLKDPEPSVLFDSFGDNSLNFELALWTASMTTRPRRFISTINFAIEKKLREHDIEIPFPQRDLHIRSGAVEIKKPMEVEPPAGKVDRPGEDSR
ncbi:MAG: mechanosensitive ion channel [Verrucomicrobiales bacterium]|jgi:small-conductance mechanosensitive channel|nr:mechanosensitive ion channel [Verrucomicrobiales bacterium]MBT6451101.1 mechanosensitive ion channel [Verrucomicrobiales bacterium]